VTKAHAMRSLKVINYTMPKIQRARYLQTVCQTRFNTCAWFISILSLAILMVSRV